MKNSLKNSALILSFFLASAVILQASEKRAAGNFKRADSNKDQKVSKEEFEKSYQQRKMPEDKIKSLWELSDADKDNSLTLEEWINGRQAMHKSKGKDKKGKDKKAEE